MSGPALKPCPFCGSSGEELMMFCDPDEGRDNSGPSRRIQCAVCNVEAPFYPSEAEAVAAWNNRSVPPGFSIVHKDEIHAPSVERCARVIDDFQEVTSLKTNARFLVGRSEGNLVGIAYAAALRELMKEVG